MAEYDHVSEVKVAMALPAVSYTVPLNGDDIDTLGFESVTFIIHSGTLGTGTIDFLMQEADDDGSGSPATFGNVAAVDILGSTPTILATEDDKVFRVGYRGKKRWVRLNNLETATWTAMIHGAVCLLSHAKEIPVAAQIT